MKSKEYPDTFKYFCRRCRQLTNHGVIREENEPHYDEENERDCFKVVQRIECMGCEIKSNREFEVDETNYAEKLNEKIDPSSFKWQIKEQTRFSKYLPSDLLRLYKESISNFNLENEIACALTLRTLIEGIGIQKNIKDELENEGIKRKNINIPMIAKRLAEKSIITENISKILSGLNVFGNDATHELIRPPKDELRLAIQIAEHIFENIYVIEEMNKSLSEMIATRRESQSRRRNHGEN